MRNWLKQLRKFSLEKKKPSGCMIAVLESFGRGITLVTLAPIEVTGRTRGSWYKL